MSAKFGSEVSDMALGTGEAGGEGSEAASP